MNLCDKCGMMPTYCSCGAKSLQDVETTTSGDTLAMPSRRWTCIRCGAEISANLHFCKHTNDWMEREEMTAPQSISMPIDPERFHQGQSVLSIAYPDDSVIKVGANGVDSIIVSIEPDSSIWFNCYGANYLLYKHNSAHIASVGF